MTPIRPTAESGAAMSEGELDEIEARVMAKGTRYVPEFQRHAREDVKRLCAEMRRLRADLVRFRETIQDAHCAEWDSLCRYPDGGPKLWCAKCAVLHATAYLEGDGHE